MIKIGNTIIDGWRQSEWKRIGLNLEFDRDRPTWIMFPFYTICIRQHKLKKQYDKYTSDEYITRKKIGRLLITEHIEPMGNKRFFNLGTDTGRIYIGRYMIDF